MGEVLLLRCATVDFPRICFKLLGRCARVDFRGTDLIRCSWTEISWVSYSPYDVQRLISKLSKHNIQSYCATYKATTN
jgi:hypothetical protein